MKTITITTGTKFNDRQHQTIEAVWVGKFLAVHRPIGLPPEMNRGQWTVSHLPTGARVCPFAGSQTAAVRFARRWDAAAGELTEENSRQWEAQHGFIAAWRAAGQTPNSQTVRPSGKRPSKPESQPDGEQFPADPVTRKRRVKLESGETVDVLAAGSIRQNRQNLARSIDGTLELWWNGQWWEIPAMAQIMGWTFDSVCETPDGRTVEHDAPDAWLRLLGLV